MKKELCRYFQRGYCQYGERCKFLHPQQSKPNAFGFGSQSGSQQQSKPNAFGFGSQSGSQQQQNRNPFGFGMQSSQSGLQQQQKPNPFGFGVQSNTQPSGFSDFGSKPNQFKQFDNKWTRSAGGAPSQKQTDNRSQATDHQCTDPESCKRIINTDFQEERPLWKLTCYGHFKHLPCDISGDISSEELRAAAYDDAKRGLNLQSIVERERNLVNSKLVEFDNLRKNPYTVRSNPTISGQGHFPGINSNQSNAAQNVAPPSFPGFSQMSTPLNMGFPTTPSVQSNNQFGHSSNALTPNTFPSTFPAISGGQAATNPFGSFNTTTMTGSSDVALKKTENNPFSTPPVSLQTFGSTSNQSTAVSSGPNSSFGQLSMNNQVIDNVQKKFTGDSSIWLKERWMPGEIPEEAPPDEFCMS